MKHLWVHACDEHVRVCAGVLCVVLCWLFLFRDGDLSVVASRPSAPRARRYCATYLRLRPWRWWGGGGLLKSQGAACT